MVSVSSSITLFEDEAYPELEGVGDELAFRRAAVRGAGRSLGSEADVIPTDRGTDIRTVLAVGAMVKKLLFRLCVLKCVMVATVGGASDLGLHCFRSELYLISDSRLDYVVSLAATALLGRFSGLHLFIASGFSAFVSRNFLSHLCN